VVLLTFHVSTWRGFEQTRIADKQTRELLSREVLVGSDKSQVKKFLATNAWDYSDGGATIRAVVRDTSRNSLFSNEYSSGVFL
jgi:hypothetical protein